MFFKFVFLFLALVNIVICIPSPNYFFNSNTPSTRMPSFAATADVSTRMLQNARPLQNLLDNNLQQKSVHGSLASHSFLDSNLPTTRISSFASSDGLFTKIFQNEQLLQQQQNQEVIVQNTPLYRERRGIVLIDEDFDVLPEPGVKQGWGNGDIYENATERGIDVMSTEEGSGQTEEVFSTGTIYSTTPEDFMVSTDKIRVTTTKEYDKMVPTSDHANREASPMEYTDKTPSTTEDIEGSGEISVQITQTTNSPTTPEPEEQNEKSTIKVCLKHTCKSGDLLLSPGITRKVPEGTNLTLSCSSVNISEHGVLKLYKYNNSDSSLLEESNKEEKLNFQISLSQRHHSGTYMCLKFTEESCCHQQLDITVYERPNYKIHLIIIGLVAAISLFICILLGIYRRFKTKNYEVEMELQNMEKPVLF